MSEIGDIIGGNITEDGVFVNQIAAKDGKTVSVNVLFYSNDHDSYDEKKAAVEALNSG